MTPSYRLKLVRADDHQREMDELLEDVPERREYPVTWQTLPGRDEMSKIVQTGSQQGARGRGSVTLEPVHGCRVALLSMERRSAAGSQIVTASVR